jgi:hypothetical protein
MYIHVAQTLQIEGDTAAHVITFNDFHFLILLSVSTCQCQFFIDLHSLLNRDRVDTYFCQDGRVSIVYASLILLATPERDLKPTAAFLTANDSTGCCQAHSNCKSKSK